MSFFGLAGANTRVQIWEGSGLWLSMAAKGFNITTSDQALSLVELELAGKKGVFDVDVQDQNGFRSTFRVDVR